MDEHIREAFEADYVTWLQKPQWDAIEASLLLGGYIPEELPEARDTLNRAIEVTQGIHGRIAAAIASGTIHFRNTPTTWVNWAQKNQPTIPERLTVAHEWLVTRDKDGVAASAENAPPLNDGDGCTPIEKEAKPKQGTDLPPYLTTSDLVACFGGYMGVSNPAKVLSEYPKWAARNGALVSRGRRGAPSKTKPDISKWDPVLFALNLLNKNPLPKLMEIGILKQQHLDTVFSKRSLTEWKPIWIKNKPL